MTVLRRSVEIAVKSDLAILNLAIDSKLRACDMMEYPPLANPFKFCPITMHDMRMVIFTGQDCERYLR